MVSEDESLLVNRVQKYFVRPGVGNVWENRKNESRGVLARSWKILFKQEPESSNQKLKEMRNELASCNDLLCGRGFRFQIL
ncbi:hypothetical protein PanWU01x14_206570 [Parasponia andersonii]|uniref:Uncharacterized protein n=1 Tax=Parasponia andersonii TaxID=3476 RepID=A0A2P5BVJ3_PARAD|nr:hypothetical protein PanWU01x14_206570 [Parasponia andersonii]